MLNAERRLWARKGDSMPPIDYLSVLPADHD
jgi:hypothetical protein